MPRFGFADEEKDNSDWEDEEDDENEPPHPVGFGARWSRTCICLEPSEYQLHALRQKSGGRSVYAVDSFWDDDDSEVGAGEGKNGPLSPSTFEGVPTATLLKFKTFPGQEVDNSNNEDEWMLHQMLNQPSQYQGLTTTKSPSKTIESAEISKHIDDRMSRERQRLKQEHQAANEEVRKFLLQLEKETSAIVEAQEKEKQLENEKKLKDEKEKRLAEEQKLQEERRKQQLAQAKASAEAKAATSEKAATPTLPGTPTSASPEKSDKPTDYVAKAKKLVAQLVAVRQSIEPFEKSKAVGKRRLGMKKIARGKLNTLSENVAKIQEVAAEVSDAIGVARTEDATIKQAIEAKQPGALPEMARGKRYLVDLLASNTITRVQAEGFNGPRGDGFPLAAMLSMVSLQNKELVPILAAHIYTVCPTAIPTLPTIQPNATEEELMSSLGMLKDKKGEYESFDRFLSRTENIVALVGNIMASTPSSHVLLGGHRGAVDWLSRFLDLLPEGTDSTLPLLTAPVLTGFLSAAGHMLANKHPEAFQKQIKTITGSVLARLDEGPIGKPSSIRLKKLVDGGFQHFKETLPSKALPELYYGATGSSGPPLLSQNPTSGFAPASSTGPSPFGNTAPNFGGGGNPFGGANMNSNQGQGQTAGNPFGSSASSNPFGTAPAAPQNSMSSSPFTGGPGFSNNSTNTMQSPFGMNDSTNPPNASPFETSMSDSGSGFNNNNSGFGGQSSGFGGNQGGGFGGQSSGFGGGQQNGGFGGQQNSGFGRNQGQGRGFRGQQGGGFGVNQGGGFGRNQGGGGGNQNSGFGQQNSGFGGNQGGGFGGNQGKNSKKQGGKPPCSFFLKGKCRFGNSCRFSHDIEPSNSGFGSNNNRSNNSPFGKQTGNSGFGGFGNQSSFGNNPFGGSRR